MERDFKQWLALFRTSIANYQYYTYFDKVFSNVDAIKVELNIIPVGGINSLKNVRK